MFQILYMNVFAILISSEVFRNIISGFSHVFQLLPSFSREKNGHLILFCSEIA